MTTDKALRGKYLYLVVAQAMASLRKCPTKLELEDQVEDLIEANPGLLLPTDELYSKPGALLGRIATMAHNMIYNFELRDHRERKAEATESAARRN